MAEGTVDVEYEPINVTVKDDNGKARIQTNPIRGLTKQHSHTVTVDLCPDAIKIQAEVPDKNDPSKKIFHRSRIRLSQDLTSKCHVVKKEVDNDERLIIYLKKSSVFRLAGMINVRR